ncbi:putative indolepyruvate decarboxylase family protein [Sugiyamaella lignohabitans]|uniref:2-hydroxyacyl-CoA lyase n=1 Tax=Sugiyamaella lignohabitans TaxID=796027 RepID=A0A167CPH2_9ASCO|nr:putative indolepyruvate decarboxylase family protein [Sugiyamaella lignohabitans]ANB11953.1 putative indolepyruvate decarboxylase family protein [Sugiyamaella lignohabitans]
MSVISGSEIIANSLVQLGVTHIFGIVGIPVIEVAEACINRGIKFISFRNEQAATYAATAYGYLTGKPGVSLVVGGPGVVHAMAGIENANSNHFPLLLLAGSSETHQRGKGAFQELNQVALLYPHTKFANQPSTVKSVPYMIEKAYRTSYFGRPGSTYIDLPADIIQAKLDIKNHQSKESVVQKLVPPGLAPKTMGDPERIRRAVNVLKTAKSPLLIVGKGAAYGRAENIIRQFQERTNIPFLPTPMGKGVIPDDNSLNVSAARSAALKNADVILLLGARLNWILHYGDSPKFSDNVKIIQVDSAAEELGNNSGNPELGIAGDIELVVHQILNELTSHGNSSWRSPPLLKEIADTKASNQAKAEKVDSTVTDPIKYQAVYKTIRETFSETLPSSKEIIYVSEGANTMDISRSSFSLNSPRTRLDAGTNATMGVGLGYAIAAKAASPDSLVVAIEGDSAFGFSAVEVETAVRSQLPMIIYVMNNSGVYHGVDPTAYDNVDDKPLPSTALQLNTAYHTLAESLGAKGYLAKTLDEVRSATLEAIRSDNVSVINVIIDSGKDKKLEFGWMASTKPKL